MTSQSQLPLIRSSERSCFKRCPQQWKWAYVDGITKKNRPLDALSFGTAIHLCLAEWYVPGSKRGRPLYDTWEEAFAPYKASNPEQYDLGRAMLKGYVLKYGLDKKWVVIGTELRFAANVANVAMDVGTIDLVVWDRELRTFYVIDHKTAGQFPNFAWLYLDDQGGSYTTLAKHILVEQGLLKKSDQVSGIMFNYLKKSMPDERPTDVLGRSLNQDGSISKRQSPPLFHREMIERTLTEKKRQLKRIEEDAVVIEKARQGELPILKAPSKDCTWCEFFDLCKLDEAGGDTEHYKKIAYEQKDMYEDHREGADNSKFLTLKRKQTERS